MSILKKLRERIEPLNVAELATLLNVAEGTVLRWVRTKQIPAIRIGNVIRFDAALLADRIELQGVFTHPIIRVSLHPREAENLADSRLRWEDLGELAPEEFRNPKDGAQ